MDSNMIPFAVLAFGVLLGIAGVFLPVSAVAALGLTAVPIVGVGCGFVFC